MRYSLGGRRSLLCFVISTLHSEITRNRRMRSPQVNISSYFIFHLSTSLAQKRYLLFPKEVRHASPSPRCFWLGLLCLTLIAWHRLGTLIIGRSSGRAHWCAQSLEILFLLPVRHVGSKWPSVRLAIQDILLRRAGHNAEINPHKKEMIQM